MLARESLSVFADSRSRLRMLLGNKIEGHRFYSLKIRLLNHVCLCTHMYMLSINVDTHMCTFSIPVCVCVGA